MTDFKSSSRDAHDYSSEDANGNVETSCSGFTNLIDDLWSLLRKSAEVIGLIILAVVGMLGCAWVGSWFAPGEAPVQQFRLGYALLEMVCNFWPVIALVGLLVGAGLECLWEYCTAAADRRPWFRRPKWRSPGQPEPRLLRRPHCPPRKLGLRPVTIPQQSFTQMAARRSSRQPRCPR